MHKVLVVGAFTLGLIGAAQADVIKRDIYGFEVGMNHDQAKAAAELHGCKLSQTASKPDDNEARYTCNKEGMPTMRLAFQRSSGNLVRVVVNFKSISPPETVVQEMCKQYLTYCKSSAHEVSEPIDKDGTILLEIGHAKENFFVLLRANKKESADPAIPKL